MLMDQVIKAGIKWILSLLNPVAALFKAIKAIIDIVIFFVQRAAQIKELIVAFIDAVKAVSSGSLGKVATAVEGALARAVPVVIGFLAAFLGLNKIADKAMEIIKSIRNRVEKAIDKIILKVSDGAKKLFGKQEGKKAPGDKSQETNTANLPAHELQDSVVGETLTFKVDGHDHQLWVEEIPGGTKIFVKSNKAEVEDRLKQWESKLPTMGSLTTEQKERARNLLANAKEQNKIVKLHANAATTLKSQASKKKPMIQAIKAADDKVEAAEIPLRNSLYGLFELFGEKVEDLENIQLIFDTSALGEMMIAVDSKNNRVQLTIEKNTSYYDAALIAHDDRIAKSNDPKKVVARNKAKEVDNWLKKKKPGMTEKEKEDLLRIHLDALSVATIDVFDTTNPSWKEPTYGNMQNGFGTSMKISPLTIVDMPKGSIPNKSANRHYDQINFRRDGDGSFYVRGHLLNHLIGGPGTWNNMTPLTRQANSDHEKKMESLIKRAVFAGSVLEYNVEAGEAYGFDGGLLSALRKKNGIGSPAMVELERVLEGEKFVSKTLFCEAYYVDPVNPQKRIRTLGLENISNELSRNVDDYDVKSSNVRRTFSISDAEMDNLLQIPEDKGMTSEVASSIMTAKLKIEISMDQHKSIDDYFNLLKKYNAKINITHWGYWINNNFIKY
jgi:hypothetical protein